MLNTLNKIRKQALIAIHAKDNRVLEEGVLYNLSCDAFYNNFPKVSSIKERIHDDDTEFKLMYSPTQPVASIVVKEKCIHLGTLLYHYHKKSFSVIDPTATTGKWCDVHGLYSKIMRLAEIDMHRRGAPEPVAA